MNYKDILDKAVNSPTRRYNDHIVLIDGMNTLIRSFALIKSLNIEGTHVGGMVGFLRSLGFLVRTLDPTRVICIFDGKGSTINRKSIDPNYKAQREHTRITNWGIYDTKQQEREALFGQMSRLEDYLKCLPIQFLSIDKVEADDVIAYTALNASNSGKKVTIVSSDQDFLQLVNEHIHVYSPIKKITYTPDNIEEALGVIPENYNMVKALLGDGSDNLAGVKGLGLKTLLKLFPELITDQNTTLDSIYRVCENKLQEKIIYAKIVSDWDKVERNYVLMNLHRTVLDEKEIEEIKEKLGQKVPSLQSATFLYLLKQDKIEGITQNTEGWLQIFSELSTFSK